MEAHQDYTQKRIELQVQARHGRAHGRASKILYQIRIRWTTFQFFQFCVIFFASWRASGKLWAGDTSYWTFHRACMWRKCAFCRNLLRAKGWQRQLEGIHYSRAMWRPTHASSDELKLFEMISDRVENKRATGLKTCSSKVKNNTYYNLWGQISQQICARLNKVFFWMRFMHFYTKENSD